MAMKMRHAGNVLVSIAMIRRAVQVLGVDYNKFIDHSLRGFQGKALDGRGLVPYAADDRRGEPIGPSRDCGNSYVSLFAPELWPDKGREWYELYVRHFWQEKWGAAGFREFPLDLPGNEWLIDVDAGPVVKGYGFAACAFGVGAARVNGHFEHAYPLAALMAVTSWPLPQGTLLVPRLLSNATDAPYLGETAILYVLTRQPAAGVAQRTGGTLPWLVMFLLALQYACGLGLLAASWRWLGGCRQRAQSAAIRRPGLQLGIWAGLLGGAAVVGGSGYALPGAILLMGALLLPRFEPRKIEK